MAVAQMPCEALPELRIGVCDVVDVPVFLGGYSTLAELPARLLGGRYDTELCLSEGITSPRRVPLAAARAVLHNAMQKGYLVTLHGLSRRLNIIDVGQPLVPILPALVRAIREAGLPAWVLVEGDLSVTDLDLAIQMLTRRVGITPRSTRMRPSVFRQEVRKQLASYQEDFLATLAVAEGVIAATPVIAAMAQRVNPIVRMIPCSLDPAEMSAPSERPQDGVVRVGFGGSELRFLRDLPVVWPVLSELARRPDVEVHLIGGRLPQSGEPGPDRAEFRVADGVPYHYHPWLTRLAYQRAIGSLDIIICPIDPAVPQSRSRSAQKWMEASLHAIPTVLQRLEPYWQAEEEVTCLKADEPAEWHAQLLRLIEDADLRRRIGEAAREEVMAKHTTEARRPLWEALVAEARHDAGGHR